MSTALSAKTLAKYFLIFFSVSLLWSCSSGGNDDNPFASDPVDPDFPEYTLVTLEPGADLENRALSALITAEPNTVVQLPAGIYDFVGELSSSVDNIVLRGTGMDAEVLNRIFDPFYTTKRREGTGLGLSISKTLIDRQGGHMRVESAPGTGTTFTMWLPEAD